MIFRNFLHFSFTFFITSLVVSCFRNVFSFPFLVFSWRSLIFDQVACSYIGAASHFSWFLVILFDFLVSCFLFLFLFSMLPPLRNYAASEFDWIYVKLNFTLAQQYCRVATMTLGKCYPYMVCFMYVSAYVDMSLEIKLDCTLDICRTCLKILEI